MIRRFVNLVTENCNSYTYSLHRLDVAKHLFYASTAEAQAANAAHEDNQRVRIAALQRLFCSSYSVRSYFFSSSYSVFSSIYSVRNRDPAAASSGDHVLPTAPTAGDDDDDWSPEDNDRFLLLSPRSSDARILHVTYGGPTFLYDANARSTSTLPSRKGPLGYTSMFISIAGASSGKENESIYLMNDHHPYPSFEVLDLNKRPRRWRPLPLPPFANDIDCCIESFTVVDGGGTICVSSNCKGTYCFDTRRHRWRHAGD
ncbi:hypothetical protein EJB05_15244, partial [Eragrostis curvula]